MKTKSIIVLVMLFAANFFCLAQPAYVPSVQLKAFWPFDATNNLNDVVAGFTCSTYPAQTPPGITSSNRFGVAANACKFNGSNWMTTAYKGVLGDTARTVSFWAKSPGTGGICMYPVGWGSQSAGNRFGCSLDYPAGKVAFGAGNSGQIYTTPGSTSDNAWHHYTFEFGPTLGTTVSNVKAWMDAIQLFSTSVSSFNTSQSVFTTNGFNVTFGQILYPGQPNFFLGDLDEAGIWRRLLTQCEISDLYYADLSIGTMSFNPAGYNTAVSNLAQFTKTLTGNSNFSTALAGSTFSGTGVSFVNGSYNFNSPPTLAAGVYSITHTYTLQGGCVRSSVQAITVTASTNTGLLSTDLNEQDIRIFPNPSKGNIELSTEKRIGEMLISIVDLSGKLVHATELNAESQNINLQQLGAGVYVLVARSEAGNTIHKKLVITH